MSLWNDRGTVQKRGAFSRPSLEDLLTMERSEQHIAERPIVHNPGHALSQAQAVCGANNVLAVDFDGLNLGDAKAIYGRYVAAGFAPSFWVWTSHVGERLCAHLWFLLDGSFEPRKAAAKRRAISAIASHPADGQILGAGVWAPRLPGSRRRLKASGIVPYVDVALSTCSPIEKWEEKLTRIPIVFEAPKRESDYSADIHHQATDLLDHLGIGYQESPGKIHMAACPACGSGEISTTSRNCSIIRETQFNCYRATCPSNAKGKSRLKDLRHYAPEFAFEAAADETPYKANDLGTVWTKDMFMPLARSRTQAGLKFGEWVKEGGKLVLGAGTGTGKTHNAAHLMLTAARECMRLDRQLESLYTDSAYPPEHAVLWMRNAYHAFGGKDKTWAKWAPAYLPDAMAKRAGLRGVVILARSYAEVARLKGEIFKEANRLEPDPELCAYLETHLNTMGSPHQLFRVEDEVTCRINEAAAKSPEEKTLKNRLSLEVLKNGYGINKTLCRECPHAKNCQAKTGETRSINSSSIAKHRLVLGVRQLAGHILDTIGHVKPRVIVDEAISPKEAVGFPTVELKKAQFELAALEESILSDASKRERIGRMKDWCSATLNRTEHLWSVLAPGQYQMITQLDTPVLETNDYRAFGYVENFRVDLGDSERVRWPAQLEKLAEHMSTADNGQRAIANSSAKYAEGGRQLMYIADVASIFAPYDVCFLDASASTPGWARQRYRGFLRPGERLKIFQSFCEDNMLRMYWEEKSAVRKHLGEEFLGAEDSAQEKLRLFLRAVVSQAVVEKGKAINVEDNELRVLVTTYKDTVEALKGVVDGLKFDKTSYRLAVEVTHHEEVVGSNLYKNFDAVAMVGSPTVGTLGEEWAWAEELSGSDNLAAQAEESVIVQVEGRLRGAERICSQPRGVVALFGHRLPALWNHLMHEQEDYSFELVEGVLLRSKGRVAWLSPTTITPTGHKPKSYELVRAVNARLGMTSLMAWRVFGLIRRLQTNVETNERNAARYAVLKRLWQDAEHNHNLHKVHEPVKDEAGALYTLVVVYRDMLAGNPNWSAAWACPWVDNHRESIHYLNSRDRVDTVLLDAGLSQGRWKDRMVPSCGVSEQANYCDEEGEFYFDPLGGPADTYEGNRAVAELQHERYTWACRWLLNALELAGSGRKEGFGDPIRGRSFLTGEVYRAISAAKTPGLKRAELKKLVENWVAGSPTELLSRELSVPVHTPEMVGLKSQRLPSTRGYIARRRGLEVELEEIPTPAVLPVRRTQGGAPPPHHFQTGGTGRGVSFGVLSGRNPGKTPGFSLGKCLGNPAQDTREKLSKSSAKAQQISQVFSRKSLLNRLGVS